MDIMLKIDYPDTNYFVFNKDSDPLVQLVLIFPVDFLLYIALVINKLLITNEMIRDFLIDYTYLYIKIAFYIFSKHYMGIGS